MTHHPTAENHLNWWLTARGGWRRLHAVPATVLSQEQYSDAIDHGDPIVRFTVCGARLALAVPGIGSRVGTRRCVPCCRLLRIPSGRGTPVNERDFQRRITGEAWRPPDGEHLPVTHVAIDEHGRMTVTQQTRPVRWADDTDDPRDA